MKRQSSLWLALSLAVGLASAAFAQDAPKPPALLDRATTLAAAAEVTRAKYPDADDVLVDDLISVRYEADGTSVTYDETWTKVLTDKGRDNNKRLPLHFNVTFSKATLDVLEVIKPDGKFVPVDVKAQSKEVTESGQMSMNIYDPHNKVLEVSIPGLEVGDVLHYRAIHTTFKARVPKTFSDWTELESTSPIRHLVFEVNGPKELPLKSIALKDEVPGTVKSSKSEADGRIVWRWEVSDVPRAYEEPAMPPIYTCTQRLLISTIGDWKEISRWYWKISAPHFTPTDEMKATVAELTKDIADRRKKIEALFKFVSQKVRYMGITLETEAPGYEPHDVRITFENKYGVCRDKAALLVAMLRLADIEAFPVLIESGPKKDSDVPQPYFNHAIVSAREPDGSFLLMDPTDETSRDLFPAYLSNMSYLVATPDGETLRTSPVTPATENLMRIETVAKLNAAGDLAAECVLHFDGVNDNVYRGFFSHRKPAQRREVFENLVQRAVAGARLSALELTPADMMDTTKPLTARLRFEARGVSVTNGETVLLPLPAIGAHVGMVNWILGSTGLEKRKYPLKTDVACGVQETLTLQTEGLGATLALPKYEPVENEQVSFSATLSRDGNTLTRKATFLMKVVEFTPAQYLTLKAALKTMEFDERQEPLFAAAQPPADTEILAVTTDFELTDAHSWTETRTVKLKVLTYAGKISRSQVRLGYNPAWETLTLESATVTNPDGAVKAIKKEEMNLMDADWVGKAPRYPAAKILAVSLPGVEVGSVIEYKVKRVCKDRPFFAVSNSFRSLDPIKSQSLRISAPLALTLTEKQFVADAMQKVGATSGAQGIFVWSAKDQPAIKPEGQLPPMWAFTPTVCVSTGDWKAYAAEVEKTLQAAAADQPEAAKQANTLVQGASDEAVRLIAIRNFVARQIRAAGPGLDELPLTAITPADRTLKEGYGNSADRAVLLLAMLRAAGFKPDFVLASGTPLVANMTPPLAGCPSPSDFAETLVRVQLNGKDVYLNDTNEYAALGSVMHDGYYGLALPAGQLFTIHALPEMVERADVMFHVELQANGDAAIRKTVRYYGAAYARERKRYAEMVPEERRRHFLEEVAQVSQAATADGDLVAKFDGYPGVVEFSVRVPRYAVVNAGYLYFTLPASLQDQIALRSETRDNPLFWAAPKRIMIMTTLTLPPEFGALTLKPPLLDWKAPQGAGTVFVRTFPQGPQLQVEQILDLSPAIIPAADYDELLHIQRLLNHPSARTILATEKK